MKLPDLGAGIVWLPGLEASIESSLAAWDLIEVEPQAFWTHAVTAGPGTGGGPLRLHDAAFERMQAQRRPVLVHSVGCAVGGGASFDARHLPALRETFDRLRPPWWSEHASLLATGEGGARRAFGFLMPPLQSWASVATMVDNIHRLQDAFGLPFAFETGVNYLRPLDGELPDGVFWGAVAERADCGILLDLHNLWTNERNGRASVASVLDALPLERVWEMHVAGGQPYKGYWLDAHSDLPPQALLTLARSVVPRLPSLHALVFEIMPDYLQRAGYDAADLMQCGAMLREIWSLRDARQSDATADAGSCACSAHAVDSQTLPSPQAWEARLRQAVDRSAQEVDAPIADPAVEIYRDLIDAVRMGTVAESLPLSTRYLLLARGEDGFRALLHAYWLRASPEPFMSEEARGFAQFLSAQNLLPHLDELLAFELAAHRAEISGQAQTVPFTCDPNRLIRALQAGHAPEVLPTLDVEVEVTPRAVERAPLEAG
ncbi:DUF692 domain-containing protein [Oleiagrimonas soli]|uniref:Uncharacterized protein (UPF0276 family) n=1 Tax=Oleiagrimonas soli TaxID=1543381 RepID=A0A841KN84_9GAMM|nr:DUF692 family multinuclear iron-containing protein [Oleiagrimonas soli]MBB6183508.1 uncharacterized protein (UPF0276 family) [Oleiagrimonas soli]